MREERLKALLENEDFLKSVLDAENEDVFKEVFANNGLEYSDDEIKAIFTSLQNRKENPDSVELFEDDLEVVSGGVDPVSIVVVSIVACAAVAGFFSGYNSCGKKKKK